MLYVASSNRYTAKAGNHHGVAVFSIDRATGCLSQFGVPFTLTNRPLNIPLDGTGRYLLVAYNAPSDLTVRPLAPAGTIGEAVQQREHVDAGIYAHQVRVAPDNRTVVLPTRGNDATASKPEDPGALKVFGLQHGQLTDEESVAPRNGYGFGPRHVDFHPSKPWMYVSMERENLLQMFDLNGGRLATEPRFVKTTLEKPHDTHPQQIVGPIHMSRDGRFVYLANRADSTVDFDGRKVFGGGENSIAVFRIDAATGEPTLILTVATERFHPRTFSIHPDGRMLVAAAVEPLEVRDGDSVQHVPAYTTVRVFPRSSSFPSMSAVAAGCARSTSDRRTRFSTSTCSRPALAGRRRSPTSSSLPALRFSNGSRIQARTDSVRAGRSIARKKQASRCMNKTFKETCFEEDCSCGRGRM